MLVGTVSGNVERFERTHLPNFESPWVRHPVKQGKVHDSHIVCVRMQSEQATMYTLAYDQPFVVYAHRYSAPTRFEKLSKLEKVATWRDTNMKRNWCGCRMAILRDRLIIIDTTNKQIKAYNPKNGEVISTIPCDHVVGDSYVSICDADDQHLIISDRGTSRNGRVSRVNAFTGQVQWASTSIKVPQGVIYDKQKDLVYVADYTNPPQFWMLCGTTG